MDNFRVIVGFLVLLVLQLTAVLEKTDKRTDRQTDRRVTVHIVERPHYYS